MGLFPKVVREWRSQTRKTKTGLEYTITHTSGAMYFPDTQQIFLWWPTQGFILEIDNLAHELMHHFAYEFKIPWLNAVLDWYYVERLLDALFYFKVVTVPRFLFDVKHPRAWFLNRWQWKVEAWVKRLRG